MPRYGGRYGVLWCWSETELDHAAKVLIRLPFPERPDRPSVFSRRRVDALAVMLTGERTHGEGLLQSLIGTNRIVKVEEAPRRRWWYEVTHPNRWNPKLTGRAARSRRKPRPRVVTVREWFRILAAGQRPVNTLRQQLADLLEEIDTREATIRRPEPTLVQVVRDFEPVTADRFQAYLGCGFDSRNWKTWAGRV